jgi:hypothetical protein
MNARRFSRLFIAVVCTLALASSAWAAPKAVGYEEVSATTGAAIGLTAATITTLSTYPDLWVMIQCQTYPVAYLFYGTPTGSTVQQIAVGDGITFNGVNLMRSFSAIGVGGTAKLAVTYFSGH